MGAEAEGYGMSDEEIVDAAIELAGKFYAMHGYNHRPGSNTGNPPTLKSN